MEDSDHNGDIFGAMGGSNEHETLLPLTYDALPWRTHPIDIAYGPQGWGPFKGAWTPLDFQAPVTMMGGGSGINIHWTQGDNSIEVAPPYAVETVFPDRSGSFVNNVLTALTGPENGVAPGKNYSSTISNGTVSGSAVSSSFMNRLRSALGGE